MSTPSEKPQGDPIFRLLDALISAPEQQLPAAALIADAGLANDDQPWSKVNALCLAGFATGCQSKHCHGQLIRLTDLGRQHCEIYRLGIQAVDTQEALSDQRAD